MIYSLFRGLLIKWQSSNTDNYLPVDIALALRENAWEWNVKADTRRLFAHISLCLEEEEIIKRKEK